MKTAMILKRMSILTLLRINFFLHFSLMENQNDVPTAQSSLPNINVKVDTQIFSKIALYVFHISNFFAQFMDFRELKAVFDM